VAENLRRAARVLGLGAEQLAVPRQVHGSAVLVLDPARRELWKRELEDVPADALIGDDPSVACAVRTADCVPVLLADRKRGRVAAIHAGWRGVAQHVIGSTVRRLGELGTRAEDLLAAIGPHISCAAFEVGPEVAAELAQASSAAGAVQQEPGQKPHVSLAAIVRAQLRDLGIAADAIDELGGCTYLDAARFFSYRRDGARSGRMLSAIVPRRAST
jgi:YfiH family protein